MYCTNNISKMYVCVLDMNVLNLSDRELGGYRELGPLPYNLYQNSVQADIRNKKYC